MKKLLLIMAITIAFSFVLISCTADAEDTAQPTTQAEQSEQNNEPFRPGASFTWSREESIEDLAARARRYIVRVEVLDERTELFNSSAGLVSFEEINTIHRLRVLEVFQGNTQPGEVIEVRQMGGELNGETFVNDDLVSLAAGEELVMFLFGVTQEEYPDLDWSAGSRPATLINPWQGIYRVPPASLGGQDIAAQADDTVLESLHPDNNLVLTVGDLARIAAASE